MHLLKIEQWIYLKSGNVPTNNQFIQVTEYMILLHKSDTTYNAVYD